MNGSKEEVEKEKGSASDGVDMSNVKGNPLQFLEEEMSQAEEQFTDAPLCLPHEFPDGTSCAPVTQPPPPLDTAPQQGSWRVMSASAGEQQRGSWARREGDCSGTGARG